MATLKVKNLSKVKTDLRKKMLTAMRAKSLQKGVAETVIDQIQKEKVPVTSEKTKTMRKYFEQANKTDKKYDPASINITFTGDQLKDLKNNMVADFYDGGASFIFEHTDGKHKKYLKPNGKKTKGVQKTYLQIAEYLKALGYDYLKFSSKNKKRVLEFMKTEIKKRIK